MDLFGFEFKLITI